MPPPSNITVTISPKLSAVTTSQSQQFTAQVTGTQTMTVNWLVDGALNGSSTVGTITAGLYKPGTAIGDHHISAQSTVDGTPSNTASVAVTDLAGYFSWRGPETDTTRQGVNPKEYALSPSVLNGSSFGKLFSCQLDGYVFAQPLYVANLAIGAVKHNVVFVATANDSLYAFDADDSTCKPVWPGAKVSLLQPGEAPANANDVNDGSMGPSIGITGTPVIDPSTNTLYLVALSETFTSFIQRIHAIDITTGKEKFGGPAVISASVAGSGSASSGSPPRISFDPQANNQRPSLLFSGGHVFVAWASHDDTPPYHGWVIAFNASTLTQIAAFSPTPDGSSSGGLEGGIWMSGAAPAADANGNVYLSVGNGTFDDVTDAIPPVAPNDDFGDSVLKLSLSNNSLSLADFFAPNDQMILDNGDIDLGSTGVVLLPDLSVSGTSPTRLMFCGGKDGNIYLLNRDNLGKYLTSNNIVQYFQLSSDTSNGFRSTPAFFNNTLYGAGFGDPLMAVTFNPSSRLFSTAPAPQHSVEIYGGFGTSPMVSSQGTSNGIVWTIDYGPDLGSPTSHAILRAYDATNLATKLYDSSQQGARDQTGLAVKFTVPTVANAKVYLGTQTELDVFGLLPN